MMPTTTDWLADLIRRVPILAIEPTTGQHAGDAAACAYAHAVREWQAETALALAEAAQEGQSCASRHPTPDAYARAGLASALLTADAIG